MTAPKFSLQTADSATIHASMVVAVAVKIAIKTTIGTERTIVMATIVVEAKVKRMAEIP